MVDTLLEKNIYKVQGFEQEFLILRIIDHTDTNIECLVLDLDEMNMNLNTIKKATISIEELELIEHIGRMYYDS